MKENAQQLIEQFKDRRVLVIGDALLDTYVIGASHRLCREAPVPIVDVQDQEDDCGGAANTALNLAALGAETTFLSVVGKDDSGKKLLEILRQNKVLTDCIIQDKTCKTISKKRITVDSNILLRMDEGTKGTISARSRRTLGMRLKKLYAEADAIVLSDYGYGVVSEEVLETLDKLRNKEPKPLIIDSKDLSKFRKYRPTAVKPNYEEATQLLQLPGLLHQDRVQQITENGQKLLKVTGATYVTVTLDEEGCIIFEKGREPRRIMSSPQERKRTIGAGDTFISALTLAIASGAKIKTAAKVATAAALVVLQKEGTVACTQQELKSHFKEQPKFLRNTAELESRLETLRQEGRRLVFTNGCFDILHSGHVKLLNQAKALGDVLIVGLNSDASIRRFKGEGRPINALYDRVAVLSGLQSIDMLVAFEEDEATELVRRIKPHVFVKGGNYLSEHLPEAALVRELGGEVRFLPLVTEQSTSLLIKKIQEARTAGVSVEESKERERYA
ncbi:D-beta-D-heptose 7-phosphate kinase/D-beta-D-heptose 1-phosphate adenosyltransferase [Pontibacter ummariensis]|uniref:Bifunctional protein HldE n=1 Tax=Pontibacter ummariensis TaxID=1610492 RepID=A0A239FHD0_9BACT|nr:D-glycero-beta-D-manno-heptose 1-phosphate adenylyltransferase [Pontibacter ummariensis]PRY12284.1 D-beta-D-heptose 7-phosphate kinase/D-beta-D-heptose 1-phosphate adenosyltransferase [Pontibacter ummariensis]SNS55474.1 D-beta-D-heptose 7-phosphate kinase / D-beta-D-heptose 1-phosphate adenosyltransferase [Pontibacter ummariensis]